MPKSDPRDILATFDERVAIAEYDGGLPRSEAEALALGEILDRCSAQLPDGIMGEQAVASARSWHPDLADALARLDLVGRRSPAWGVGYVVAETGRTYRPAGEGEPGHAAIIVPVTADGCVIDLAAQDLATGRMHTRLDVGGIVGADEIERARASGQPLMIFATLADWLRGGCRGSAIVDWRRAGAALDGVATIITTGRIERQLRAATARCWPVPSIYVIANGVAHAAAA
jgi:hypothetical protein